MTTTVSTPRTFKILSIDGGGYKGLYSAAFLQELETAFGRVTDYFDMLCGTSTGGLIALALGANKSAEQVVEFYKRHGSDIFPPRIPGQLPLHLWKRWVSKKYLYEAEPLIRAAHETFGTMRMGDSIRYLCIPAYNAVSGTPRVFKTDHDATLNRDDTLLMREIAVATSAAPTFFPPASVMERSGPVTYLDGGLWANNPALVGLIEASRFFVGPTSEYDQVAVLSVGNVSPTAGWMVRNTSLWNPLASLHDLVSTVGNAQEVAADQNIKFLATTMAFPVIYHRVAGSLSPEQAKAIALDKATAAATDTLLAKGAGDAHVEKRVDAVKYFFKDIVPPRVRK